MTGLRVFRLGSTSTPSPRVKRTANRARPSRPIHPPVKHLSEGLELRRRFYVVAFGHHAGSILAYHIGLLSIPV